MAVLFGHLDRDPYSSTSSCSSKELGLPRTKCNLRNPETVLQHILNDVVASGSENFKKSRKRRISECLTVYYFTVIVVMKVSCFLVGSQDVSHGASGDQQRPLREYGGMGN